MGCDIHIAVEKKVGDKWVMRDRLHYTKPSTNRNYPRFAALAGVRGDGPDPRGLPEDIGESTRLYRDEWGSDGHSDSWLPLKEACRAWLETDWQPDDFARKYPECHYFDVEDQGEYRVVFWFDN